MIIYGILGILITFFFDMALKGGEHELDNKERILITLLWPLMLIWFLYHLINESKNNE